MDDCIYHVVDQIHVVEALLSSYASAAIVLSYLYALTTLKSVHIAVYEIELYKQNGHMATLYMECYEMLFLSFFHNQIASWISG